jgi:thermitase
VEYATYNYYVQALNDPNDPEFWRQWAPKKIDAPEAWDIHTGSNNITIAVLDTGVDLDHPDLSANIVGGYDFVNEDYDPQDDHYSNHGTHVAGIAAAIGNNGKGIAGIAWGAEIMPVKVLNSSGSGTVSNVEAGINYAVTNGAQVINMSLGAPGTSYPCTGFEPLRDAMQNALNNGVLVVVAAGNESTVVNCPAAYDQALAVGSTTSNDLRSWFSNYGSPLDITAPGSSIYSTIIDSDPSGPGTYGDKSGTSMATPHVSGLAALIWSFAPSLSHIQVRNIIQDTAEDLGTVGWDQYFGHGRINAWNALETINLYTYPEQLTMLIDDTGPASGSIQVLTTNPNVITWTTRILPSVSWLSVSPPDSGTISAASSPVQVTLAASSTTLTDYDTYTTTVLITGTTASGVEFGPTMTEVELIYVPEIFKYYFPLIFKN